MIPPSDVPLYASNEISSVQSRLLSLAKFKRPSSHKSICVINKTRTHLSSTFNYIPSENNLRPCLLGPRRGYEKEGCILCLLQRSRFEILECKTTNLSFEISFQWTKMRERDRFFVVAFNPQMGDSELLFDFIFVQTSFSVFNTFVGTPG